MSWIAEKHVNGHGETYYVADIDVRKMRSARGFTSGSRLSFLDASRFTAIRYLQIVKYQEELKSLEVAKSF